MQKIKRTDVRRSRGKKSFLKTLIITLIFLLLFAFGFWAASYLSKIL